MPLFREGLAKHGVAWRNRAGGGDPVYPSNAGIHAYRVFFLALPGAEHLEIEVLAQLWQ